MTGEIVTGNVYDKYATRNPLYRRLMAGFLGACRDLLAGTTPSQLLEVGCGPGELVHHLMAMVPGLARARYVGIDIGLEELLEARRRNPGARFAVASADALPFADSTFDGLLACEVLEHLEDPDAALAEIRRVANDRLLLSVPWEPIWRFLNMARGSYLRQLGNTPGHLQHFSRRGVRRLVARHLEIVAERRPFPWTVLAAKVAE